MHVRYVRSHNNFLAVINGYRLAYVIPQPALDRRLSHLNNSYVSNTSVTYLLNRFACKITVIPFSRDHVVLYKKLCNIVYLAGDGAVLLLCIISLFALYPYSCSFSTCFSSFSQVNYYTYDIMNTRKTVAMFLSIMSSKRCEEESVYCYNEENSVFRLPFWYQW